MSASNVGLEVVIRKLRTTCRCKIKGKKTHYRSHQSLNTSNLSDTGNLQEKLMPLAEGSPYTIQGVEKLKPTSQQGLEKLQAQVLPT